MTEREAWLAERRKRLTASDAGAVLGLSPYRGPLDVWREKRGEGGEVAETERMRLGRHLEGAILSRYAEDLPEGFSVEPNSKLVVSAEHPWLGATPDAYVRGPGDEWIAQAKATSHRWAAGVPLHYQVQVAVEMVVTGSSRADVPVIVGGSDYECHRVDRHLEAEAAILEQLHEFWECVQSGRMPTPKTEHDIKVFSALVPASPKKVVSLPPTAAGLYAEMVEAQEQAAECERRAKAAKAQLMGLQGDAEIGVLGNGLAMKRTTVNVPAKQVGAYSFERYAAAKWER